MTNRAMVERIHSDYTDAELFCVMATLIGAEPEDICSVTAVITVHAGDGGHELRVVVDSPREPAPVARLLRHAADHVYGGCASCRRNNRKRGNAPASSAPAVVPPAGG